MLGRNQLRNLVLLLFSYLFYLFGAPDFILVLVGSTLFDYAMGRLMGTPGSLKRLWLALSIGINLGLLAWFKYANFMVAQSAGYLAGLGIDLDGVVIGEADHVAVDVGVAIEAAVDVVISGALDGAVPAVQVTADDGNGGTDVQTISVTITDVNEAPTDLAISSSSLPSSGSICSKTRARPCSSSCSC